MPSTILSPLDELDRLSDNSVDPLVQILNRLIAARVRRDEDAAERQIVRLARMLAQTRTLADLLGRRRVLMEMRFLEKHRTAALSVLATGRGTWRPETYFDASQHVGHLEHIQHLDITPTVPRVEFKEAIQDILDREPFLADPIEAGTPGGRPLWQQVRDLYEGENAFALAKSTDLTLTQRIQQVTAGFIRSGQSRPNAPEVIAAMGGWSRAYGETVFRTNMATAYNAGRRQMVKLPGVRETIPAFRFTAVNDRDTRENHGAAHGLIAPVDHSIWNFLASPLGYNCRCSSTTLVSRFTLSRMGLIDAAGHVSMFHPRIKPFDLGRLLRAAHPDPGFRTGTGNVYAA